MAVSASVAVEPSRTISTTAVLTARSRRSSLSLNTNSSNDEKKSTIRSHSASPKRLSTSTLTPPRRNAPYRRESAPLPINPADKKSRKHALAARSTSLYPPIPTLPANPATALNIDEGVECQLVFDDTPSLVASENLSDSSVSSFLGGSRHPRLLGVVNPHGFVNLGNTCYFNSALQLLLATSNFTNDLCSHNFLRLGDEDDDSFVKIPSYVVHVIMDGGETVNTIGNGEYESAMEEDDMADEMTETEIQNDQCVPCACDNFVMVREDRDEVEDGVSAVRDDNDNGTVEDETEEKEALKVAPLSHSLIDLARYLRLAPPSDNDMSLRNLRASNNERDTGQGQSFSRFATGYPNIANPKYLKDQLDAKSSLFYGYEQQDAHEFVVTMLDLLHDELVAANKIAVEERRKKRKREAERQAAIEAEKSAMEAKKASLRARQAAKVAKARAEAQADAIAAAAAKEMFNQFKDCSKKRLLDASDTMASQSQSEINSNDESQSSLWPGSIINIESIACGMLESVTGALTDGVGDSLPTSFHQQSNTSQQNENGPPAEAGTTNKDTTLDTPCDDGSETDSFVHIDSADLVMNTEAEMGNPVSSKLIKAQDLSAREKEISFTKSIETDVRKEEEKREEEKDSEKVFLPTDNFHMEVDVQLECDGCKYKRSHKELYNHLSLDLAKSVSSAAALSEAVVRFFAPAEMDLTCEKCGHGKATQRLRILNAPRALLLHVKRFNVEYDAQWRPKVRKNHSRIEFHESLRLDTPTKAARGVASIGKMNKPILSRPASSIGEDSTSSQNGTNYRLKAVVHHLGHSVNSGHYVADALHPPMSSLFPESSSSGQKPKWHRFNDSQVNETSRKEVFGASAQSTAYLLMYELQSDLPDRSILPPSKKKGWKTIPAWKPLKLSKAKSSATSRSGRRLVVS